MPKDLKHQLHTALVRVVNYHSSKYIVSPDYGIYVTNDKLYPKDFYKFPNSKKTACPTPQPLPTDPSYFTKILAKFYTFHH